ncbi:MAG: hypothetical protein NZM35_01650 [Chitinophagales bacterium]|nr:hypothetical protein [Chitinophagales bacterium]MDW8418208.1 hypothetical protein [Chitinophagales bacterium]
MLSFTLALLALAAGVYLLIKIQREYLGLPFKILGWLVVILSVGSMAITAYNGLCCCTKGNKSCGNNDTCCAASGASCRKTCGGGEEPHGAMTWHCEEVNDSCLISRETCVKIMGEAACDSIIRQRGRCILSKEECKAGICKGSRGNCAHGKSKCCKGETTPHP